MSGLTAFLIYAFVAGVIIAAIEAFDGESETAFIIGYLWPFILLLWPFGLTAFIAFKITELFVNLIKKTIKGKIK